MSEHAVLAPSGSHRWFHCPGSIALSKPIPDDGSVAAREGTFAHEIAARCLKSGVDASAMVGDTDGEFIFDEAMAEHLQEYLDVVRELVSSRRGSQLKVEERVTLVGLRNDVWGTGDALILAGSVLHVADLKFGSGVFVDVEENPQLMIYGLGALLTFSKEFEGVKTVVLHIVQPRHHRGGHRQWEISAPMLRTWGETVLKPAAEATDKGGAELAAGDWCNFCRAKIVCPVLKQTSLTRTRHLFADEHMTPAQTPPSPVTLTPDQIAKALHGFEVIEQWMKGVRAHAYDVVESGTEIPGFKLVQKTGHRKWNNPEAAQAELEMFLPEDKSVFAPAKLVSPAQAEKLLGKKDRDLVERLASKPATGTVLVRAADPRPAITAGDVFDDGADLTNPEPGEAK